MNERGSNMEDDERANPSEEQNDRRRKKYKSHKESLPIDNITLEAKTV